MNADGAGPAAALGQPQRASSSAPLPGDLLIADRGNSRLLIIDRHGKVVWRFPRPGDLRRGETFKVPDDAFFSPDGRRIVATQEDDYAISVVDVASHRIVYRYGTPGTPGAGPNQLYNPDDAMMLPDGRIVSADIKNCRLITIAPGAHAVARQLGETSVCQHNPPLSFGSPNGAFPTHDGRLVVTEINGDWANVLEPGGRLISSVQVPGFSYPSDTNEARPGVFLSVDYVKPGAIEEFDMHGHVLWRFAPTGADALNQPSLALPLPNGDVIANDDFNHRVIIVDPRTNRIVWQYGHTGRPGSADGYLNVPDGVDLAPPHALTQRLARVMRAP